MKWKDRKISKSFINILKCSKWEQYEALRSTNYEAIAFVQNIILKVHISTRFWTFFEYFFQIKSILAIGHRANEWNVTIIIIWKRLFLASSTRFFSGCRWCDQWSYQNWSSHSVLFRCYWIQFWTHSNLYRLALVSFRFIFVQIL